MAHFVDSGSLEALTPDDSGILREWTSKYATISEARTEHARLSIYSSPIDLESPEVDIPLNGSEVQVSKEPAFERCCTVTTSNGLRIFLRAGSISERDSWIASLHNAKKHLVAKQNIEDQAGAIHKKNNQLQRRCCGNIYMWDNTTQKYQYRFVYLSPGYLHEMHKPFQYPTIVHDLTYDAAIRVQGTPPRVELKLGTGEVIRFYGRTEKETKEWFQSIKERGTQRFKAFSTFESALP